MLSFVVFDDDRPTHELPLRHAHMIGKESIPVAAKVEAVDGTIVCRKPTGDEAALALQFDAGPPGVLTLQTCLLPDRERPYLLELELARHRIMLFLNKLEEWSLADLPADHPIQTRFEEARSAFSEALTTPRVDDRYTSDHARLAREALALAIEASEMLTLHQAERQLMARLNPDEDTRPISAPRIGSIVHNDQFSEPLKRVVASHFDFISSPMRWRDIEKEEGKFSFAETDRWIEWAVRSGKVSLMGGPVLDFSPRSAPAWLYIWEHDYSSLREFAYEHAKRVVTRYRRTISRWNVISGANLNDGFAFSIDQMLELTRLAVLLVRKLHPSAKVVVDLTQPFGEHASTNPQSVAPLLYAELVMESGIQIDAFGLRLQFGDRSPGRSTRDLMQFSAILDAYSVFEKPLDVTAIGVPSDPVPPGDDDASLDPGRWHSPWSLETQSQWMSDATMISMGKPFVRSFCWQALFDIDDGPEMPAGGLITTDGRAKPALRRIGEGRKSMRARQLPRPTEEAASPAGAGPASGATDD